MGTQSSPDIASGSNHRGQSDSLADKCQRPNLQLCMPAADQRGRPERRARLLQVDNKAATQIVPHRARQATHRTRSSKEAHRPSSDSPLSEVQFRGTGSAFRFDTQPVARFKDRLLLRSTQIEHPLPFVLIELWASPPPTLA